MTRPPREAATPCPQRAASSWSREQIRAARAMKLEPLLARRGLVLHERGGGNAELAQCPGLLLKASYWRWPQRQLAGNTIDFYVKVLGASFTDAMKEILGQP